VFNEDIWNALGDGSKLDYGRRSGSAKGKEQIA